MGGHPTFHQRFLMEALAVHLVQVLGGGGDPPIYGPDLCTLAVFTRKKCLLLVGLELGFYQNLKDYILLGIGLVGPVWGGGGGGGGGLFIKDS